MAWDHHKGPPEHQDHDTQAASGGPKPVGYPTYGDVALQLFENGYEPLPLHIGKKNPIPQRWSTGKIDRAQVERWCHDNPDAGVGLRTGRVVGIDIDVLDPEIAHQMGKIVEARIGAVLMRVGLWPKRLYMARTDAPFAKLSARKLEILGRGQQFVAFGIHPDTGKSYYWPTDDTPLDLPFADLPLVDEAICRDLLSELALLLPSIGEQQRRTRSGGNVAASLGPTRNAHGLVVDGRDGWLSTIAYHAVHDTLDAGVVLDAAGLADRVWARFAASAELSRGRGDSNSSYGHDIALRKVRDKLGLYQAGRLPPRLLPDAEPVKVDPGLPVVQARELLSTQIGDFCTAVEAWHESDCADVALRLGLRATVGLGKSAVSRTHILALQARLKHGGQPHRILVFVSSLALADEAATGWMAEGVTVAVHRGYEAMMPGLGIPMCRDLDMVRMAIAAGLTVFPNACLRRGGAKCHNFNTCAKQANLNEVGEADIVVAAYDSLFTGLPIKSGTFALMVIDEGCWERAVRQTRIGLAEITVLDAIDEPRMADQDEEERDWTALCRLRTLARSALVANGSGPLSRKHLQDTGLTVENCMTAAALEISLRVDPGLRPGLPQGARKRAVELSREANRSVCREALFHALAALLQGTEDQDGRVWVMSPDQATGAISIEITGLHQIKEDLAHLPVLHLDATLRPALAQTVLPGLKVVEITAALPHTHLTAVQGGFGKSSLVEDPKASSQENQRRSNRLQDCVDHVRWESTRVAPKRTLVVTYKQIESAFAGIPGVVTGHFKAIAGLDAFKDVALLIVIGRPLPDDRDLGRLTNAYLGHVPSGGYQKVRRSILMRDSLRRAVSVIQHSDPLAELLRSAVCDDEVIQAIGRGRGVNRTADNPLEIQILADVALPQVHDRLVGWDSFAPDIMQKMLLAGVAVDSPTDAAALYPHMFSSAEVAKKAFQRGVFGGHSPIENSYRDLSLKSAAYRRGGRGRSWQRAWWIGADADAIRQRLFDVLGEIEEWR